MKERRRVVHNAVEKRIDALRDDFLESEIAVESDVVNMARNIFTAVLP
jgi:hypothetical protein